MGLGNRKGWTGWDVEVLRSTGYHRTESLKTYIEAVESSPAVVAAQAMIVAITSPCVPKFASHFWHGNREMRESPPMYSGLAADKEYSI